MSLPTKWTSNNIEQSENFAVDTFDSKRSHGHNPERLAKISAVFRMSMRVLGWKDYEDFIDIITDYQASIDGKFHKDFVNIAELQHYVNTLKKSRSGSPNGFYSSNPQQENIGK